MIRSPQVLTRSFWPISDLEGVNGDYVMVLSADGSTPIIFGPKVNNTWVGVPQTALSVTPVTFLQYLGDNAGAGQIALPSNGTGVPGQICFLLDIDGNCTSIATNVAGIWTLLITGFAQTQTIYSAGGSPVFIRPVYVAPPTIST